MTSLDHDGDFDATLLHRGRQVLLREATARATELQGRLDALATVTANFC